MEKLIIFVADQIALSEDENGFLHLLLGPDRTEVLGVTLVQVAELVNQFNLAQGSTALFQLGSDEANMRYLLKFLHKVPELEFSTSAGENEVRIKASDALKRRAIMAPEEWSADSTNFKVLRVIAAHREKGIPQSELTKLFKLDPRSLFHFIKQMTDLKLIEKIPISYVKTSTNLCIHARFYHPQHHTEMLTGNAIELGEPRLLPVEQISNSIMNSLLEAKNQTLPVNQIWNTFLSFTPKTRKWFFALLRRLEAAGYVKQLNVTNTNPAIKNGVTGPVNEPRVIRCVQLLKTWKPLRLENDAPRLGIQEIPENCDIDGLCPALPINTQILTAFANAQDIGLTLIDLHYKLGYYPIKVLTKRLEILMSQGEVKRIMEFSGRERRARYFLTEIAPIVAGVPDYLSRKSGRKTPTTTTSTNNDNATVEVTKKHSKHIPPNMQAECRRSIIQNMLKEEGILSLDLDFHKRVETLHRQMQPDLAGFTLDRKTILRDLTWLEQKGLIKQLTTSVELLNGKSQSRKICMLPEIDEQKVEEFLQLLSQKTLFVPHPKARKLEECEMEIDPSLIPPNRASPRPAIAVHNFLEIAVNYGYIRAKMARAREFHYFLLSHYLPGSRIELVMVFQAMTLAQYLALIGHIREGDQVEFIYKERPELLQVPLSQQPEVVRDLTLDTKKRHRTQLLLLCNILAHLRILQHTESEILWILLEQAPICVIDPQQNQQQHLLSIRTLPDAKRFWQELELAALACSYYTQPLMSTLVSNASDEEEEEEEEEEGAGDGDVKSLGAIHLKRHWVSVRSALPSKVRQDLLTFVNRRTGETPVNQLEVCKKLAAKHEMSVWQVQGFFSRYGKRHQTSKAAPKPPPPSPSIVAPPAKKARTVSAPIVRTFAKIEWHSEEDEKLLTALAIAHGSTGNVNYAAIANELFPQRDARGLKLRTAALMKDPTCITRFIAMTQGWGQILQANVISDLSLEQKIVLLRQHQSNIGSSTPQLAKDWQDFQARFTFTPVFPRASIGNEQQIPYTMSPLMGWKERRRIKERRGDLEPARNLIRLIMNIPVSDYQPHLAFHLLANFEESILKDAIDSLKLDGVLVKAPSAGSSSSGNGTASGGGGNERFFGRNFSFSNSFLSRLNNCFPLGFDQSLAEFNDGSEVKGDMDGGKMAGLLEGFAQGHVSFKFPDVSLEEGMIKLQLRRLESNKLIRPVSISATTTTTPAMVEPEIESVGQEGLAKGNAKLWLDLQGKVRKDSFKNCLDLVTSQVLQYPGISLKTLELKCHPCLTRGELEVLLSFLMRNAVLKMERRPIQQDFNPFTSGPAKKVEEQFFWVIGLKHFANAVVCFF